MMQNGQADKGWVWEGDVVRIQQPQGPPLSFALVQLPLQETAEFIASLWRVRDISLILATAKASLMSGKGDYANAKDNIGALVDAIEQVKEDSISLARGIDRFFQPKGIVELLGDDPSVLNHFLNEALERLEGRSQTQAIQDIVNDGRTKQAERGTLPVEDATATGVGSSGAGREDSSRAAEPAPAKAV